MIAGKGKHNIAFALLCFAYFALWLAQGMNGSTAAICAGALGAGKGGRAASAALFFAGGAASRPLAGYMCDRGRTGAAMCAGLALYLASCLFAAFAFEIYQAALFVVCRLFQGFGCCAAQTAMLSLAAERSPDGNTGKGVSLVGLGQAAALGMSAALAMGILSLPEGGEKLYLWTSITVAAGLFMAAVCAWIYKKLTKFGNIYNVVIKHGFPLTMRAAPPALIQLAAGMAGVSCLSYMTLFAQSRGLQPGVFFAAAACAMLPARLGAGKLCAKTGELPLVFPAALAGAVALALLPTVGGAGGLSLCAVFYGLSTGVTQPMLNAAAVRLGERRGASTATFMLGADIGLMLGAAVWGGALEDIGFGYVFVSSAFLLAAAGVASAMMNLRLKNRNPA